MIRISDFDAITFDVYGTLIDWEPSIVDFLRKWAGRHSIEATDHDLIMAFDRARARIQQDRPAHPYPDVLRRCFDQICADFDTRVTSKDREEFARETHSWPAYQDSHAALVALQARINIGALSNIDEASLATSCMRLDIKFDVLVTAERVRAYKPDFSHFKTAILDFERLGIRKERILHVGQSLRADITPANKLGLKSAWVNRPGRVLGLSGEGASEARPDLTVSNVAELVRALSVPILVE
jgi:2-haloalkanoic acid dehalogenase type II